MFSVANAAYIGLVDNG